MSTINRREFELALLGSVSALDTMNAGGSAVGTEHTLQDAAEGSLTDVPGVKVGHFTDPRRPTGCTAILFEEGAAAGVDYDGSAPGDFQAVLLQPVSPLQTIWGIMLAGGAAYGLATTQGAMRYFEERGIGAHWIANNPDMVIPIVVGAIISDLGVGDGRIRPDAESGYQACRAASTKPVAEGCVGVGAGATVGSGSFGSRLAMKSGIGTATIRIGDLVVSALMVVNAAGNIVDWRNRKIIAGARRKDGKGFADISEILRNQVARRVAEKTGNAEPPALNHTTIGIVATNATFDKTKLTRIAMLANTGAARVIHPYHTPLDGDQLFAVSTRKTDFDIDVTRMGMLASQVVSTAILRAGLMATSVEGYPAYRDFTTRVENMP